MTAADDPVAAQALFLDTSLLIPATVEAHPAHADAAAFLEKVIAQGTELCISAQVCREFLVVLTRQPVSERVFRLDEALGALQLWTIACRVVDETATS